MLKAGELPCLVATSSLELGIDMGAVDLVLQVESPKSVARGCSASAARARRRRDVQGPDLPKFRSDLLECAVVIKLMREGRIEPTVVPRNALDVLAQQIVAIAASAPEDEPVSVDDLFALVTRTYSYASCRGRCSRTSSTCSTAGYPSREFGDLRPRIVWDRVGGTIRARKGSRALAITNAGTIPDRGLFMVTLPDGRKVGELDEEMVYEARPGQTFLLGASTWRIEDIGRDRVTVTPAPGAPGAVPFWRGDSVGRRRSSARRSARSAAGRSTNPSPCSRTSTTSTRSPPRTSSTTCASSRRPPASCRAIARSSSSASATRSATGGCASCRRTAGASTPPGRSR
jgi:ATP-dependent Lhr-like helicase